MVSISVKELRERLPFVRAELKKGITFLVIYKSKPIAKLMPVDEYSAFEEATDMDVELATINDFTEESQEFLSEKELNYYLSLKDLK